MEAVTKFYGQQDILPASQKPAEALEAVGTWRVLAIKLVQPEATLHRITFAGDHFSTTTRGAIRPDPDVVAMSARVAEPSTEFHHYPTDVLGGAALGGTVVLALAALLSTTCERGG